MKRLIKKMPHRQGLENYILAYANEKDGAWHDDGTERTDQHGNKWKGQDCLAGGSVCSTTEDGWREVLA